MGEHNLRRATTLEQERNPGRDNLRGKLEVK